MARLLFLITLVLCIPAFSEVGFYTGAFDPVHLGHIEVAREAGKRKDLKHIVMYPAIHPNGKDGATDFSVRLSILRKALADDPYFIVPPEEIIREKLASPRGIEALLDWAREQYGPELVQVMGDDAFVRFTGNPKNAESFLRNPRQILIFERTATPVPIPEWAEPYVGVVHASEVKNQGYSSTRYRADPIANSALVLPVVDEEVKRLGLYGCRPTYRAITYKSSRP